MNDRPDDASSAPEARQGAGEAPSLAPVPDAGAALGRVGLLALDHVGIAVHRIAEAAGVWSAVLGLELGHVEEVPDEGVRAAFLRLPAGGAIELLEPLPGSSSAVARFLERRGPGVHHLSFRVSDCRAVLRAAEAAGITALPPAPRSGSRGSLVAFFDPRHTGGVLIEVCERTE